MERIPFGVARLDTLLEGGAPPGSVVLLSGETGAGARAFLQTSAAMNALARADEDLFDLHYGDLHARSAVPPAVHYLSFTAGPDEIRREMSDTMSDDVAAAAVDAVSFRDLSPEYFQLSAVPPEWYLGETATLQGMADRDRSDEVLSALGGYLTANAADSLVVIDSVTDLVSTPDGELTWNDVAILLKGLGRAAARWRGLILLLVNEDALTDTEFGALMDAVDGTLQFAWDTGGSQRARTMVVRAFRGVLPRLEAENIVRFETEIHEGGFDISDVRKIR